MNPLGMFPPPGRSVLKRTKSASQRTTPSLSRLPTRNSVVGHTTGTSTPSNTQETSPAASSPTSTSTDLPSGASSSTTLGNGVATPGDNGATTPGRSSADKANSKETKAASRRPATAVHSTTAFAAAPPRLPASLSYDYLRPVEVGAAYTLERAGYPEDDAASLEKLKYRQSAAPHLFIGAYVPLPPPKVAGPLTVSGQPQRRLIGYICGTAAPALTLRSMSTHSTDEDTPLVCIHSVCVANEYRRRGLATGLLAEYSRRIRRAEEGKGDRSKNEIKRGYEQFALLAHEEIVPLYEKAGFRVIGHSHIQHGSGGWLEMRKDIIPRGKEKEAEKKREEEREMEEITKQAQSRRAQAKEQGRSADAVPTIGISPPTPASTIAVSASNGCAETGSTSAENEMPAGITQEKLLAALRTSSATSSQPGSPCNPGIAYTQILGQTLAAKTPAEDSFMALEARLVKKEGGTNLADLYCPREECGCILLSREKGEWTLCEAGPLLDPSLSLPSSPAPPAGPSVPLIPSPSSVSNVPRAASTAFAGAGPLRGFWSVSSPMTFENIGFSRDTQWTPPWSTSSSDDTPGLLAESPPTSPHLGATGSGSEKEGGGSSKPKPPKPTRKGTWRERMRDRSFGSVMSSASASPSHTVPASPRGDELDGVGAMLDSGANSLSGSTILSPPSHAAHSVKVKYLLCAECDCGPLGFVILPSSMPEGAFGKATEEQLDGAQSGQKIAPQQQELLVAADRVRYRFPKT